MSLMQWKKPTTSLTSFPNDFNRIFEEMFTGWPFGGVNNLTNIEQQQFVPAIELIDGEKSYTLKAELPGLKSEEVELQVHDNVVTIKGERKTERKEEKENYVRSEISYGSFMRQVALPSDVDGDHAEARMDQGVLTLRLPKKTSSARKHIKIG